MAPNIHKERARSTTEDVASIIEEFETGPPVEKGVTPKEDAYVNPEENIANKKYFSKLFKDIAECPYDDSSPSGKEKLTRLLRKGYTEDAEMNAFHPVNEIGGDDGGGGIDAIQTKLWEPIKKAFPDLERRDNLIVGGTFRDKVFVGCMSCLVGTFQNEWFGVRPTNTTIFLRLCEAHEIVEENNKKKIRKSYVLIDTIDFLMQCGYDLKKLIGLNVGSLGCDNGRSWPAPIKGDGSIFENRDEALSKESIDFVLEMQRSLNIKPELDQSLSRQQIWQKLYDHPQRNYFDNERMMWYGPSGIGTCRSLSGFVTNHQLPFRLTFKKRDYWALGHYIEVGDGPYSLTGGWHSIQTTHQDTEWPPLCKKMHPEPTHKVVTMRVMDFYYHEYYHDVCQQKCKQVIRENWVPIDMTHVLYQIGIDVFDVIREKQHEKL